MITIDTVFYSNKMNTFYIQTGIQTRDRNEGKYFMKNYTPSKYNY